MCKICKKIEDFSKCLEDFSQLILKSSKCSKLICFEGALPLPIPDSDKAASGSSAAISTFFDRVSDTHSQCSMQKFSI